MHFYKASDCKRIKGKQRFQGNGFIEKKLAETALLMMAALLLNRTPIAVL
jgi:hypothetical protein